MTLPVILGDEASAEFDEAFDYYESQRPGRGADFVARVEYVLDRLGAHPLRHGVVFADIRKALVPDFPYCVFYRPLGTHVEVIAVFHSSRDPAIWQGRA